MNLLWFTRYSYPELTKSRHTGGTDQGVGGGSGGGWRRGWMQRGVARKRQGEERDRDKQSHGESQVVSKTARQRSRIFLGGEVPGSIRLSEREGS